MLYVRNLPKAQKQIGMPSSEFAAHVGISLSTLRRIKKGMPVSDKIASRIRRRISREKWKLSVIFEQPNYVLKLALDPNHVRLTGYNSFFKVPLISAPILIQAINGHAFTKTFAKRLRSFLRRVPLEQREFSIEKIQNPRNGQLLEECRAKIGSLVSGDELTDLVVTLREQFRCFFQRDDIIDKKNRSMKKNGRS